MNYYKEISELIEKKYVKDNVRRLQSNNDTLKTYYEIGKLLVQAQGGETRAKYGNGLIKEWSEKLVQKYGKGYDISNLKRMRQFYILLQKSGPLGHQFNLSWTHWRYLLPIKNENERNYYINQCILNNLSKNELINLIKKKSFDRLSYVDKNNIKIINIEKENSYSIKDMLLDPIIINIDNKNRLSEKVLRNYILDELRNFFLQLGTGFLYAGSEYKIKYMNKNFYMDMLLFNVNLNCYIVVELKLKNTNYKDISQIKLYRKLVDENIKKNFHDKTIGLIISKKNDNFIFEYVNDEGIFLISYEVNEFTFN